jgi:hypothetical protein
MMKTNLRFWLKASAVTIATLVALSGCGGGDGQPGTSSSSGPGATGPGATNISFIAFIKSLLPGDETSQPVTFSSTYTNPPEDNTGTPVPL